MYNFTLFIDTCIDNSYVKKRKTNAVAMGVYFFCTEPLTHSLSENGCNFAENIFKCIFLFENGYNFIQL